MRQTVDALRAADLARIRGVLGQGHVDPVAVDTGWDSRVYLVDGGEVVFKFARRPDVVAQFRHERAVLDRLEASETGVRFPRVRWASDDSTWIGYLGIPGVTLDECLGDLPEADRRRVGRHVGDFLRDLHRLDLPDLPVRSVDSDLETYRAKLELPQPVLQQYFTVAERREIEQFVGVELAEELQRHAVDLVVGHGDLGPWNIVVGDGALGVIDFGDAGWHDAAKDLSGFGDSVVFESACDAYGADDATRRRAHVRALALPVLDIPFYVGMSDAQGIRQSVDAIRTGLLGGGRPAAGGAPRVLHRGR